MKVILRSYVVDYVEHSRIYKVTNLLNFLSTKVFDVQYSCTICMFNCPRIGTHFPYDLTYDLALKSYELIEPGEKTLDD